MTSDLVVVGDVDGLVGRHSKHKCFPYPGEFLGTHQAEKGPFGHVHHGALAASVRREEWRTGSAGPLSNQRHGGRQGHRAGWWVIRGAGASVLLMEAG